MPRLSPYEKRLNTWLDDIYATDLTYAAMTRSSGLSYNTVRNIGVRRTKRPQLRSVLLLAQAAGYDLQLVEESLNGK